MISEIQFSIPKPSFTNTHYLQQSKANRISLSTVFAEPWAMHNMLIEIISCPYEKNTVELPSVFSEAFGSPNLINISNRTSINHDRHCDARK